MIVHLGDAEFTQGCFKIKLLYKKKNIYEVLVAVLPYEVICAGWWSATALWEGRLFIICKSWSTDLPAIMEWVITAGMHEYGAKLGYWHTLFWCIILLWQGSSTPTNELLWNKHDRNKTGGTCLLASLPHCIALHVKCKAYNKFYIHGIMLNLSKVSRFLVT